MTRLAACLIVGAVLAVVLWSVYRATPRSAALPSFPVTVAWPTGAPQAVVSAKSHLHWRPTVGELPGGSARPGSGAPLPETATILSGLATWYCATSSACTRGYGPRDLVAAIDRKDTPYRKGDRVRVRSGGKSVVVRIVDVCACRGRRVIDLTSGAFSRLAPLSRGVIPVTLEGLGEEPLPTLPATDGVP